MNRAKDQGTAYDELRVSDVMRYTGDFTPPAPESIDGWQIPNDGSFIEPPGYCSGASTSAMWYYLERNRSAGPVRRNAFLQCVEGEPSRHHATPRHQPGNHG